MDEQHALPSDSDESDVDYKPEDEESLPSEEDSDGCAEETPVEKDQETSSGKRKKKQSKRRKKTKKKKSDTEDIVKNDESEGDQSVEKLTPEEEKKKADSLWNEFMKDCTLPPLKKAADSDAKSTAESSINLKDTKSLETESPVVEKENKEVVAEVFEFAGEKILVEKEVAPTQIPVRGRGGGMVRGGVIRGRGGGLASIVGQLGKKNKLSTLEKSKLDWSRFKKEEGIEEDLQTHNKGKEGYLERQDFLQRADLRQFEIEKQMRTSRSNR